MEPADWTLLEMLPPSPNHDPFHHYVNLNGDLSDKGRAAVRFAVAILDRSVDVKAGPR